MKLSRAVLVLAFVMGMLAWPSSASATSLSVNWQLPANGLYTLGIDHVYQNGTSGSTYEQIYEYPYSQYNNNAILPNPVGVYSSQTLSQVRLEFYSRPTNPPSNVAKASVAIRLSPNSSHNIGMVKFPTTGKFFGDVRSRTAVTAGRVQIHIFQTTGQPTTSTGYAIDAFSATDSTGATYNTNPLWDGQYIAYITDKATGRQAIGFMYLKGDTRFDLDLDIPCFGIDECQMTGAAFPNTQGQFHSVNPSRIVDTRENLQIPGAVTPGDGRNSDPNPFNRTNSKLRHEFVVAGTGGVPARGVSAVLINVTVTKGTNAGVIRLIPKPPRTAVWQDQSSYPPGNYQAPGIYWSPGETKASMQLVKVGVGGRVRLESYSSGNVHFIVDVVGWVDQGQPNQGGERVLTVPPSRLLDTRTGTGGPQTPFGNSDTRQLDVTGGVGIPADANAVIGNLTATKSSTTSFQTVWPSGTALPIASVLNSAKGTTRPNMVMAPVGGNGNWSIFNETASTELLFDAVGYLTDAAGSTGKVTAVPSAVILGATSRAANSDVALDVTGVGGVPTSGVSAVWVLITVNGGGSIGYLTAYPSGTARPVASNLNWMPRQSTANLALVPVGADGNIRLFNETPATVTVSVVGWVN